MSFVWPRRAPGLPPGQRLLTRMPRFTDTPHRAPPPSGGEPRLVISREGEPVVTIGPAELRALGLRAVVADFHCVTTWSVTGVTWTGVPLAEVLRSNGLTVAPSPYLVAYAQDHRRATFVWEDALAPDVLLATELDGEPLGLRHGGPLRLVAPKHYGYKSIKHLLRIDLSSVPPHALGKEHLRGRVALEERHPRYPSWLVRIPYRLLIPPTAGIAERTLPRDDRDGRVTTGRAMRVPLSEHRAHQWVIDQIAPDFTLEDSWRLPATGGADDFGDLVAIMASRDRATDASPTVRLLFGARELLGRWFGWDAVDARALPIPGCTETTLAERLPEELRGSAAGTTIAMTPFRPLYRTDDEWTAEVSNGTVHAVMQLCWVDLGEDNFAGQMGVYVKPRGRLGQAYMAFIRPFRHRIVYPAMLRQLGRAWDTRRGRRE